MSNPFASENFKRLKKYMTQNGGGKFFCGVITPQGKVWTHGDVDDFLKDAGEKGPRKSLSCVPTVKMPCLPRFMGPSPSGCF